MLADKTHFSQFHKTFWVTSVVCALFIVTFGLYVWLEKRIDHANDVRNASLMLADELRQSSDDLTRMVRTYIETGNPIYKQHYLEILDIRNGKAPRPVDAQNVYWDLILADGKRPRPFGETRPLLELLQEIGCTEEELRQLTEAKAHSDKLSQLEMTAMQLIEPASGDPASNREKARAMLHDDNYHRAKALIMKTVGDFSHMIDQRTTSTVKEAAEAALAMRWFFIALGIMLGYQLWRAYRSMHLTLGTTVDALHQHIAHLGSGDFSKPIEVPENDGNSVLAWLGEMRKQLEKSDARRRVAEADAQQSIGRLNEAQRIAHLGSWHLDLVTNRLSWSDEIFRLFEIDQTRFDATYEAFLNAVHPEDREAVDRAYTSSLANRTPYEITHRLRMADGRIKWVHERCTTDFDAQGKPLQSMGTVQDITERKLADEQLRIAATAFESQEGMMVTDANSVILRVNKAFTETTGYTAEEVIGQTPRILQSGHHDAEFYRAMWQTIVQTGAWQGEVWDRHKSGRIYPKWLTISAVKDEEGRVTHYVGTHYDITERKQAEEKIHTLAFYDQLTGLPNRTLLMDRMQQLMAASARNDSYCALLFLDLDNFKVLNDSQGHEMGDLLLRQVAERLRRCIRDEDTAARQGGDEFVILLSGLGVTEAEAGSSVEFVAQKILSEVNQPYIINTLNHRSTTSIGVTLFKGNSIAVDELMKQADLAMYRAKSAGRNNVCFFDAQLEAAVVARAGLEDDLRRAIDEQQFVLHYQPQVISDGSVVGAEALVRWEHPQRGMVPPVQFITLTEETNLIVPLGRWVLQAACAQLAAWANRTDTEKLTLAVNVSVRQFRQSDFVDQVLAIVRDTGANPRSLKIELTESMMVQDVEDTIAKMLELQAHGIGFSLDDFGTGYSSLSYLKRLPLDQLKIDRSFVTEILSNPNDAAIAQTIVALGQSLGLSVIAEGVETAEQRDFLGRSGCHAFQGYLFSKPVPIDGFERFIAQSRNGRRTIE